MKKLASIDVGLKRIGVAICLEGGIVVPQTAIFRKNRDQASRDVDLFLKEWKIDILVVGVPKGGSSEEGMTRGIEYFVSLLKFNGRVEYQDEYGSSLEAKEIMKGVIKQKKDGKIDSMAAKIILDRWLVR
ncbi:MAG: Holliday junction resolvase RuvX [Sulfurospirillum sp.]|nr:Holliday junction resolvase RuvX [Sulfurospirillum sp.]MBL0703670.1 Holliday junction resolvase RuvX [Sulfurospirillum sp.]